MSLPESLYETALVLSQPAIRAAAMVHGGADRAVRGRRASLDRYRAWSVAERDDARPLVWVHAPSVGEALMAQAVIRELRAARPDVQVAFTHFSPSTERMVDRVGADVHGYVPFDTRGPVRKTLRALRPSVIAFVRTEVWPVLTREAAQAGAAQVLINAVLSEGSGRLRWLGRSFLESAYRRLAAVGAVSDDHARRYELLGVPPGCLHVTGDARFDQVTERIEARALMELRDSREDTAADEVPDAAFYDAADDAPDPSTLPDRVPDELRPMARLLHDPVAFTLVAGSTWPEDEKVLIGPFNVLARTRRIRLVIAPHEPDAGHLASLERRLDRQALRHARLSALLAAAGPDAGVGEGGAPEVVVVDRAGILADLYALADAAYVGGGFGTDGLHSVVEPAALGVPVLFGPAHGNAREADALAAAGGGFVVDGARGFEDRLRGLMDTPGAAGRAGESAAAYVRSEVGAAVRNARLILDLLPARTAGSRV